MSKSAADSSSNCLTVWNAEGDSWIDLTLGATFPLGNVASGRKTIQQVVAPEWAAACGQLSSEEDAIDEAFSAHSAFNGFTHSRFVASADEANELALWLARSSGARDGYRVLTLLGSQHGGTLALRSASGRPDWQSMDGPVCSGFRHLKPGVASAIEKAIDETVAAVMISPVDWSRGGVPFDTSYLQAVQTICRDKSVAFILDETRLAPGVTGEVGFWSHADLEPDLLTLGAGWFHGMPGGLLLSRMDHSGLIGRSGSGASGGHVTLNAALTNLGCFSVSSPVHRLVFRETLTALMEVFAANSHAEPLQQWSLKLEELKNGFDLVREIAQRGWWTTLALDIPAAELVNAAAKLKLRLRATGDSTVLVCPPVVGQSDEIDQAVKLLRQTLEKIETASTAEALS